MGPAMIGGTAEPPRLPPPLWGRVGVGGREIVAMWCRLSRPPPPTRPQPHAAITRDLPLNHVTEVGNSRLRLGEGRSSRHRHGVSQRLWGRRLAQTPSD